MFKDKEKNSTTKIWHKSYDPGVPFEIDVNDETLVDMFYNAINKYPKRIAFINMGKKITFKEFGELTLSFASFL